MGQSSALTRTRLTIQRITCKLAPGVIEVVYVEIERVRLVPAVYMHYVD